MKDLAQRGEDVADLPYVAYGGARLAPFNADQEAGFQDVRDAAGIASGDIDEARRYAGIGAAPIASDLPTFDRAALERYGDPYNEAVIDATRTEIERQGELARRDLDTRAGTSGGIGSYGPGVRANLEREEQRRNQADVTARTTAGLRSQNFAQAQAQFEREANRGIATRQNDAARAGQASGQYADIGGAAQDYALRGAGARYGIGATQQAQDQRSTDIGYSNFLEQRQYPYNQVSYLSNIYRGLPTPMSQTQSQPGPNPWVQGIGLGIGALGTLGSSGAFGSSGWLFKRGGIVGASRRRSQPFKSVSGSGIAGGYRRAIGHMAKASGYGGIAGYSHGGVVAKGSVARRRMNADSHRRSYGDGGIVGYQTGGQVYSGLSVADLARLADAGDSSASRELAQRRATGRGPATAADASDFIEQSRDDFDRLIAGVGNDTMIGGIAGDDQLIDMEPDDAGIYQPGGIADVGGRGASAGPRMIPSRRPEGITAIGHNGGPPLDDDDGGIDDRSRWMPLTQAGLGIAASRNPSALGALAEGLGHGIDAWGRQREWDREAEIENRRMKLYEDAARREQEAADVQQAALDAAVGSLPAEEQAMARVNPDAFLKPKEAFTPDLQTINRGGTEETGFWNDAGDWEVVSTAPRWQPQGPGSDWQEGKGEGGITFKYNQRSGETNLAKPSGGFYSLPEIAGEGPPQEPTQAASLASSPMPAAASKRASAEKPFDWQRFQTPKQAAEADPTAIAKDLRDEFTKITKDYRDVSASYAKIESAANNPSAAGDLALIFGYMKMLDPGSTVREGEFATAQNSAGIPQQVVNMYNRALNGERLAPEQRSDFAAQAKNVFGVYQRQYDNMQSQYEGLATRFGVAPEDVIVQGGVPGASAIKQWERRPDGQLRAKR